MQEKFSHGHQKKTWLFVLNATLKKKTYDREIDAHYILAPLFTRLMWSMWPGLWDFLTLTLMMISCQMIQARQPRTKSARAHHHHPGLFSLAARVRFGLEHNSYSFLPKPYQSMEAKLSSFLFCETSLNCLNQDSLSFPPIRFLRCFRNSFGLMLTIQGNT